MALSEKNTGAALIPGGAMPEEELMVTKKVKVVRPFYYNRILQEKDSTPELPKLFAMEVVAAKKAVFVEDMTEGKSEEPTPASEPAGESEQPESRGRRRRAE